MKLDAQMATARFTVHLRRNSACLLLLTAFRRCSALFKLRRTEHGLERSYLGAMAWFNGMLTLLFVALMALAYAYCRAGA